ncbi:MAG: type II secretion system protein GspJ [Candidatus Omnitrophota bacterium]
MSRGKRTSGFTFVEIICVIGILGVVGLAVFTALSRGLDIWTKLGRDLIEEDAAIFFNKISLDLKNAVTYADLTMNGNGTSVRFPVTVSVSDAREPATGIGQIEYEFVSSENAVYRRKANFSDMSKQKFTTERKLMTGVNNFSLQYYRYDPERDVFLWSDDWDGLFLTPEGEQAIAMPLAVRISMEVKGSGVARNYRRTVSIPRGWWGPWRIEREERSEL